MESESHDYVVNRESSCTIVRYRIHTFFKFPVFGTNLSKILSNVTLAEEHYSSRLEFPCFCG